MAEAASPDPGAAVVSVDRLPIEALVVDTLSLRVLEANASAARLFARPRLVGANLPSLLPELDRARILEMLDGERSSVRFSDRRGRSRRADLRATRLSSGRALLVLSDTTAHDRTEASLRRAFLTQKALSDLLRRTLDARPLEDQLEDALTLLLDLPWCPFGPRGAVLLAREGAWAPVATRRSSLPITPTVPVSLRPCACGEQVLDADGRSAQAALFPTERGRPPPMIEMPLESAGTRLGMLVVQTSSPEAMDPFELDLLRVFARHLAQVIFHVRAREEAREHAESSRLIIERAVNAIVSTDRVGRVTGFNPAAEVMFGWRADEILGQPIGVLMAPEAAAEHEKSFQAYEARGLARVIGVPREVLAARRDGTVFPILLELSETPRNGHLAFTAFIRDETERRRIREELVAAREAAVEASETKSRFLANMSHEIRTPMNGVIGMTEMLLETRLDDAQRDAVETIRSSGEALLSVINDILDFSRIEAGRLAVEPVPFKSEPLLKDVVRLLESRAQDQGIALVLDVDAGLPAQLEGDAGRLRQILINLLGNAVKFTEEGQVRLEVRREHDPWVRFVVRDTGVGISPEGLAHLFQPFVQADGSITRRFGGTGLGLSISKQLAELMGGELAAESQEGVGSTFTLRLPLPESHEALVEDTVDLPPPELTTRRALLVEDNPVNQKVAARMLKRLDLHVEVAANGLEALERLEVGSFDLVLMDCQMPVMDGFEATREIRRRGWDLPVVALTASAMKGDEERCRASGMTDFLSKPVRRADLEAVLGRLGG